MSLKFSFRELTLAANQKLRVHEVASFFMLVSDTGTKRVQISIDDDPFSGCPVGYEYLEKKEDEYYSHIDFKNPNAAQVTIEYIMSSGLVRSSPTIIALSDILAELRGDTTPENWGIVLVDPATATEILAANVDRKGLLIQLVSGTTCGVFLGFDNTVTIDKFFRALQSDEYIYDGVLMMNDYRGPIWGKSTGADVSVSVGEW